MGGQVGVGGIFDFVIVIRAGFKDLAVSCPIRVGGSAVTSRPGRVPKPFRSLLMGRDLSEVFRRGQVVRPRARRAALLPPSRSVFAIAASCIRRRVDAVVFARSCVGGRWGISAQVL